MTECSFNALAFLLFSFREMKCDDRPNPCVQNENYLTKKEKPDWRDLSIIIINERKVHLSCVRNSAFVYRLKWQP